jgi:hypothetical protein
MDIEEGFRISFDSLELFKVEKEVGVGIYTIKPVISIQLL